MQVLGSLTAAGDFGILQVTLTNATLTIDPSVQIAINLNDPGTDPFGANPNDGKIRISELTSFTGTTDWTRVTLLFDSGDTGVVTIGARLGMWGGASHGTACPHRVRAPNSPREPVDRVR